MRFQKGFTLSELIVGLAVAGLTLSIGVPSFSDFVANQTQSNATNDLVTAMTLARSEAIKQNRFVTVCKSANGLQCNTGTDTWETGWIVFSNTNQANAATVDANEDVIKTFMRTDNKRTVEPSVSGLNFVAFRPTGTATIAADWLICDNRGDLHARSVSVDRAGRARANIPDIPAAGLCN